MNNELFTRTVDILSLYSSIYYNLTNRTGAFTTESLEMNVARKQLEEIISNIIIQLHKAKGQV